MKNQSCENSNGFMNGCVAAVVWVRGTTSAITRAESIKVMNRILHEDNQKRDCPASKTAVSQKPPSYISFTNKTSLGLKGRFSGECTEEIWWTQISPGRSQVLEEFTAPVELRSMRLTGMMCFCASGRVPNSMA